MKEVLSSNKEKSVKMPELHDYVDFEAKITREEFEARIEHVFERMSVVFDQISQSPYISEVNEVELLGGGLRVPKVRTYIEQRINELGPSSVGQHMNADEAMAFGAAYIGANFSSGYNVQKVHMYQQVTQTVYLNIT